jgi:hypothetical protein
MTLTRAGTSTSAVAVPEASTRYTSTSRQAAAPDVIAQPDRSRGCYVHAATEFPTFLTVGMKLIARPAAAPSRRGHELAALADPRSLNRLLKDRGAHFG